VRWLQVAGISPRRLRFDPRSVQVSFLWTKWHCNRFFLPPNTSVLSCQCLPTNTALSYSCKLPYNNQRNAQHVNVKLHLHIVHLQCKTHLHHVSICVSHGGTTVAQSVETLRYNPEGRGFDSPMVSLKFFIDIILPAALWPWG